MLGDIAQDCPWVMEYSTSIWLLYFLIMQCHTVCWQKCLMPRNSLHFNKKYSSKLRRLNRSDHRQNKNGTDDLSFWGRNTKYVMKSIDEYKTYDICTLTYSLGDHDWWFSHELPTRGKPTVLSTKAGDHRCWSTKPNLQCRHLLPYLPPME